MISVNHPERERGRSRGEYRYRQPNDQLDDNLEPVAGQRDNSHSPKCYRHGGNGSNQSFVMYFINPRADDALDGYARKRLASEQDTDLTGVPMADSRVKNRHEWPQSRLNAGVAKIDGIESSQPAGLFV